MTREPTDSKVTNGLWEDSCVCVNNYKIANTNHFLWNSPPCNSEEMDTILRLWMCVHKSFAQNGKKKMCVTGSEWMNVSVNCSED